MRLGDLDGSLAVGSYLQFVQPMERRTKLPDSLRGLPRGLSSGHRLTRVGLFGRLLDALIRLGNLFRPTVPWRTGRAAAAKAHEVFADSDPSCYGRRFDAAGWIALHYAFFYPMNDWRSRFRGVNDHEADWETVVVYLDAETEQPMWLAYASHDHAGDDLRRHWDDPEVERVGERPVVYVGAGSHAAYFSPGEYLTTVHIAALGPFLALQRFFRRLLGLDTSVDGFDIPYVDQAPGTGVEIGPGGTDLSVVPLDERAQPWVGDYRGLWGLDVDDPAGGERAPAGPKFERNGDVRRVWADPVGWAGLTKVLPPSQVGNNDALVDAELVRIDGEIDYLIRRARLLALSSVDNASAQEVRDVETGVSELRLQRRRLEAVRRGESPVEDLRSHLTRPAEPASESASTRGRLLSLWAMISAPIIIAIVGIAVLSLSASLWMGLALIGGVALEALTKRRFIRFVAVYVFALALLAAVIAGIYLARGAVDEVIGGGLIAAAGATLIANVVERFRD